MAIIPTGQKFHTVPSSVQTTERGSALANSQREIYTMQDIIDTASSKFKGIHALLPLASGKSTFTSLTSNALSGTVTITNRLYAVPFIPNQDITTSALYMNIVSTAGGNARILIYSDLNGLPDTKLYESTTLDCSTTGIKTATTSFNFLAGTTYWVCMHSSTGFQASFIQSSELFPLDINGITNANTHVYISPTFGSAPTIFGTPTIANGSAPFIGITKA